MTHLPAPTTPRLRRATRWPSRLAAVSVSAVLASGCGASGEDAGPAAAAGSDRPSQAVRFAECMRTHGISAFPDPGASGEFSLDGVLNGSTIDPQSHGWKSALAACHDLQPPGFTGRTRTSTQQSAALEFADCVREHGVKDFPDPAADAPLIDTNRIPSTDTAGGMAVLNAAMDQCSGLAGDLGVTKP